MDKRRRNNVFCLAIIMCIIHSVSSCCVNFTVAYVTERSSITDVPFMINRTIGLVEMAMNKAREKVKHAVNLNFIMAIADIPGCTPLKFGALVAETYHRHHIDAVIGPGCSNAVEVVGRLTAAWNLPHITYGGTSQLLGNKTEFSTLTRLSFTMTLFAKFYMEVFKTFSWTDVAFIYDESQFLSRLAGKSLQQNFRKSGFVNSYSIPITSKATDIRSELLRALNTAKKVSRVFLLSCHGDILRQAAIMARQLEMDPGEYTIIYFISDPSTGYIGNHHWRRGDELDYDAKLAYESVLVVRPRRPISAEFDELERIAIQQSLILYNYKWPERGEILKRITFRRLCDEYPDKPYFIQRKVRFTGLGIMQLGQYDAFMLYAHALLKSLDAGEDPRNATLLNKHMWNNTFPGLGGMVFVTENGDRDTDFSLLDLDPVSGEFRTVAQYLGYTRKFELLLDVPVHWPNNAGPTPNRPKCGFVGELCVSHTFPLYGSVTIAFAVVILIIVTAGLFWFRRVKAEAAIQSQWWRIKFEDLSSKNKSVMLSTLSKPAEDEALTNASGTAGVSPVGVYKGAKVHIRRPNRQNLTVNRNLLLELKEMREVTCPNLTRLIGVCPEPNNVCIVTEYCSRGSLRNILHGSSMQLDKEFRISLINDIVQGMYYIHTSPIGVHGRLNSSTCVIDSRFVLKVTGFGLKSITFDSEENERNTTNSTDQFLCSAFWTAPELLRSLPAQKWSQPGDVYSFAIILYEMCTRNEPYASEPWYESVEDAVEQIKSNRPKPRRPSFGNNDSYPELYKLANACWTEKPEERPTFREIRKNIYFLRRGNPHGNDVLDMLLHRMEQYANNLEELVEERTNAFLEEKKRSEELLYQVLPKSVADQLKVGHTVTPEAFGTVTIYFSDIVGFTTISAASTPFQVVDFLNDVYTCFDGIIDNFDVYKVETIGDAYMVVSGLPVRNANEHVRQIARMSLRILEEVKKFVIQHQPDTPLRARIGIHSGPVVAGVVGLKMPRYCLFGDTVNTASRMESNGKPMMIHISDSTKELLDVFGSFTTEKRGSIEIKGKGLMLTHWLVDEIPVGCSEA